MMIRKTLLAVTMSVMITAPALSSDVNRVFRDRYGNITETWQTYNGHTDVRDRYGNMIGTRDRYGQRIDLRDRYGNYEGEEIIDD